MTTFGMNMLLWTDDCTGARFTPLFRRLKAAGFDNIDVPVIHTNKKALAALGRRLADQGLDRTAVTLLAPGQSLISTSRAHREAGLAHLYQAIDCCHALGSPLLSGPFFAALGEFSGAPPTDRERAMAREALRRAAERAREAKVTLAIEYLNRFEIYLLNCLDDTLAMVRDVDHPNLQMMLDTFHANIEEKDVAAAILRCAPHLVHVQCSENDRSTPGAGSVRWDEIFAALAKINYQGSLTIEAFGPALPSLAAATRIWRRMFRDEETLAREGLAFIKKSWRAASRAQNAGRNPGVRRRGAK